MEFKSEFEFTLNSPIKYQSQGDHHHDGRLLVLKAPSNKVRANRAKLKQAFMASVSEGEQKVSDAAENQKDTVIADDEMPDYILMMLYASKSINMAEVLDEFMNLLTIGKCCKVEGAEDLTKSMFEEMDADDTDRLLGEYMANFIIASFLKKMKES